MSSVCVIGAGPAGSTFAARMAQLGHDVCLVERQSFPRRQLGELLSPGVLPLLDMTGARQSVEAARFRRVRTVRVKWERAAEVREDPREQGLIVDRGEFDRLLLERAKALGVRILQPATMRTCDRGHGGWTLGVETQGRIVRLDADFLANARGRAGGGAGPRQQTARRTLALYGYWRGSGLPQEPHIEAGEEAWYWGVPLPDGTYNTLVFVDVRRFRERKQETLAARFLELLRRSGIMAECSDAQLVSPVSAIDATPYLDRDSATSSTIKLGDAALAIDPLSSSGVQKAIQGALQAAIVANTLLCRRDMTVPALEFYRSSLCRIVRAALSLGGRSLRQDCRAGRRSVLAGSRRNAHAGAQASVAAAADAPRCIRLFGNRRRPLTTPRIRRSAVYRWRLCHPEVGSAPSRARRSGCLPGWSRACAAAPRIAYRLDAAADRAIVVGSDLA